MKELLLFLILMLVVKLNCTTAQVTGMDTLQYKGDPNNFINLVIMGDGYTSTQQGKIISDAKKLSDKLFADPPWSNYKNYFNIFVIKAISVDSGATHPDTLSDCSTASPLVPATIRDTYFGCSFDNNNVHRLIYPQKIDNIINALATKIPAYDIVVLLSNSPYYGAGGGDYATITLHPYTITTLGHECGHTFGHLQDEYYAGDQFLKEADNSTQQSDPLLVKWRKWFGINGIGVYNYCCGGNSGFWYKPANNNCRMETGSKNFCSVCMESIIEKIHDMVNPLTSYTPASDIINSPERFLSFKLIELAKPIPNTFKTEWKLDDIIIAKNTDSVIIDQAPLVLGSHTLNVTIVDTTTSVKTDNHSSVHFSTVSWKINKTSIGIDIMGIDNRIACSVFPNPVRSILYINIEFEKSTPLIISIISEDGKLIREISNKMHSGSRFNYSFDIENMPAGTYILIIKMGGLIHAQKFIKE